jgi:hypothetical protein
LHFGCLRRAPRLEAGMTCEHDNCHCQSEIGIERNGRNYCSENCSSGAANAQDTCVCGHAGCSTADEMSAAS